MPGLSLISLMQILMLGFSRDATRPPPNSNTLKSTSRVLQGMAVGITPLVLRSWKPFFSLGWHVRRLMTSKRYVGEEGSIRIYQNTKPECEGLCTCCFSERTLRQGGNRLPLAETLSVGRKIRLQGRLHKEA